MRTPLMAFILSVLLAGVAPAQQQGSTSYTPDRTNDAPNFMNAEVVRVDRATNRVTFRSESRETALTVEGEALATIGSLRGGDKVVVGYRIVKDADGREIRYVTSVEPASPTSGDPRRVTTAAGVPGAVTPGAAAGLVQGGNQQGGNQQGTGNVTPNSAAVVPDAAVVGGPVAGPGSPQLNPVPNVPTGAPVQGVVLPPAVARQPLSQEEVGTMRARGEADLAAAAVALSAAANALDGAWAGFKGQCLPGFTPEAGTSGREWYLLAQGRILTPTDDACRALHADLTNRVQGFMQQVDTVEDAARKADVLPARVREVFDRHTLR